MTHSGRKGSRGEREAGAIFVSHGFPDCRRRTIGDENHDEKPGRDLYGTPGFCVQVQFADQPRPALKLAKAKDAAEPDEIAVAFTRRTRDPEWMVSMSADDFFLLVDLAKALAKT